MLFAWQMFKPVWLIGIMCLCDLCEMRFSRTVSPFSVLFCHEKYQAYHRHSCSCLNLLALQAKNMVFIIAKIILMWSTLYIEQDL